MEKEKKIEIQTVIRKSDNLQFLLFKNYIISVLKTSSEEYEFHFYKAKKFEKEFILKKEKDEKKENINYDHFKLIYTKNKKLYIIAYEIITFEYHQDKEYKLSIFKLDIEEKKIEKMATYDYIDFNIDLKENKIYITDYCSIIIYDLLKDTSNIFDNDDHNGCFLHWQKLFLIDNYFIIISFREKAQYFFYLFGTILDKNFKNIDQNLDNRGVKYIFPEIFEFDNYFFPISDNYFLLYSYIFEQKTIFYIVEVRIKGKEDLIKSLNEEYEDMEQIDAFIKHKIEIEEAGEFTHYPIDNEKFGINISNRNIYIYKIDGLELIWKFNLNCNTNEKLLLIDDKEKNEKYKLALGSKNKILFLSS